MKDEKIEIFKFPKNELLRDLVKVQQSLESTCKYEQEITEIVIDQIKNADDDNSGKILSNLTDYVKATNDKIKTVGEFYKGISVIIRALNTPEHNKKAPSKTKNAGVVNM